MAERLPAELCPACAYRTVPPDSRTGWCIECTERQVAARYQQREAVQADERRQAWAARTRTPSSGSEAIRERQRRHRLKTQLRPRELPTHADPLEIGKAALQKLNRLERNRNVKWFTPLAASELFDEVAEAIKELAWGPQD